MLTADPSVQGPEGTVLQGRGLSWCEQGGMVRMDTLKMQAPHVVSVRKVDWTLGSLGGRGLEPTVGAFRAVRVCSGCLTNSSVYLPSSSPGFWVPSTHGHCLLLPGYVREHLTGQICSETGRAHTQSLAFPGLGASHMRHPDGYERGPLVCDCISAARPTPPHSATGPGCQS